MSRRERSERRCSAKGRGERVLLLYPPGLSFVAVENRCGPAASAQDWRVLSRRIFLASRAIVQRGSITSKGAGGRAARRRWRR